MSNSTLTQCPICSWLDQRKIFNLDKGCLVRCRKCKLFFYTPRPTADELKQYYDSQSYRDSYRSGNMVGQEFADNRYRQFSTALKKYGFNAESLSNRRLLDVGCGTGEFLFAALQHDGWHVEGLEVADATVQIANQRLGMNRVHAGLIGEVEMSSNAYDVITSYHVIEHLLDPLKMLTHIYELLKPQGIIFLETPNIGSFGAKLKGKNWSQIMPPEHINYFAPSSLKFCLKKAGFTNIYTYTIRPQRIQSLSNLPEWFKPIASSIYEIAPRLNLGATLQAIATKP